MSWARIRGHERLVESFRAEARAGRLAHAYLFVGPEGVGKRTFAVTLAQARFCRTHPPETLDPCGTCPACKQIIAGTHPDLIQVRRPEDKHDLPISVVRDLTRDMGLKSSSGRGKVAILDDADAMNAEAANALLKTLEEPPAGSMLLLIGTSVELQLETVISRCRVVPFDPLGVDDLAAVLAAEGLADSPEAARDLAERGEGSVRRALGLADSGLQSFRRELINALADDRGFDPSDLAGRFEAHVKEAGKESVEQRARASLLAGELAGFFRALLWQAAGLAPPAADPDDRDAIGRLAVRLEPEDVLVLADRCLEADYHIHRKAYMKVALEALCADLGAIINKPRAAG